MKKGIVRKRVLNSEEIQEAIRKKAYELFEKRGCSHGNDWQDWLDAERIVTSQMRKY